MFQHAANAAEGDDVRPAVHGLAGHHDQGPATHPPHQGQPAVSTHLLLLVPAVSTRLLLIVPAVCIHL